jgi:WD40 repeat protein
MWRRSRRWRFTGEDRVRDGRTAVSGGGDGTVRVWDLAGEREQARWIAEAAVLAVAFNTAVTMAGDTAGQVHALQLNVPAASA